SDDRGRSGARRSVSRRVHRGACLRRQEEDDARDRSGAARAERARRRRRRGAARAGHHGLSELHPRASPMAGFVGMQLADWGSWDAAADYAALVKSGVVMDASSEFAITSYLKRAAKAGVVVQ